jgi:hypothetical protein
MIQQDDFLPILILNEMKRRIESLNIRSWDRSNNPNENRASVQHAIEHWFVYNGSQYSEHTDPLDFEHDTEPTQDREMEFLSFVKIINPANDYTPALQLHESIMRAINRFTPDVKIDGLKSPLMLKSDTLLPPRGDETTFRYQAVYKIITTVKTAPSDYTFQDFTGVNASVYRSDIGAVGSQDSAKDAEIKVTLGV